MAIKDIVDRAMLFIEALRTFLKDLSKEAAPPAVGKGS